MANKNFDPNARYDNGPSAAGSGRISTPAPTTNSGLATDNTVTNSNIECGFNCAGNQKKNNGPNVAGNPRSYNNT